MTINAKKFLIISNLVTIAVTACAVLIALHYNDKTSLGLTDAHLARGLQSGGDCCDCNTGLPITPTPAPTKAPTKAPTRAPNAAPTPVAFCFPRDATVQLSNSETIPLGAAKIGTKVHVGDNRFEPIYSFGHYAPKSVVNDYVRLSTTSPSHQLILSPAHLVWTCNHATYVPASQVVVGDELLVHDVGSSCQPVTGIETNLSFQGMMAPFTPSGTLMINNIKVSSFVAVDDSYPAPHYMAHAFEFPHRVMCHYLASCASEKYTEQGISLWVAEPLAWGQWVVEGKNSGQQAFFSMVFALFVAAMGLFVIVELACFQYPLMGAMAIAGAYFYYSYNPPKNKHLKAM